MSTTLAPDEVATPVEGTRSGTPRPKRGGRRRRGAVDWLLLAVAVLVAVVIIGPFLLILLNSFKSAADYSTGGPLSLPSSLSFQGIATFWERVDFPLKIWNSILISGLVAVFGVAVSVLNAYALGIGRIRGRTWMIVLFLLANLIPQEALLYPLYNVFKGIGLYDTVWSVVIIFTVIQSAFGTYLLSSVYATFPKAVLEAASLDGASKWRILTSIVVPMSRSTLSVLAIFFFIWTWNEFLIPLTFLVSNDNQTVPIGIATLQGQRIMDVTTTSASALLGLIPTLVFFLIFQRTLTRGISAGAVK